MDQDKDISKKKVVNLNSFRKRKKTENMKSKKELNGDSTPLKNKIAVYVQLIIVLVANFYLMQRWQGYRMKVSIFKFRF